MKPYIKEKGKGRGEHANIQRSWERKINKERIERVYILKGTEYSQRERFVWFGSCST